MEIALERLDRLHIHEEIVPRFREDLVKKILEDGVFINPIIVDRNTLVVLDGMHRVAASQRIGFGYIPVCLVDYANPGIVVGCWYRLFKELQSLEDALKISREMNLSPLSNGFEASRELVERREAVTTIFSESHCYAVFGYAKGIRERYQLIKDVEVQLLERGYSMAYETERDSLEKVNSREYAAGLMTPPLRKAEVIETALDGVVFSQKTTRHIIPARPMNINVPIKWLYEDIDLEEANALLERHLSTKKIDRLPPGQVLDRRYDEELYVFR